MMMMIGFSVEYDFSFSDDAALVFDCIIRAFDPRFGQQNIFEFLNKTAAAFI